MNASRAFGRRIDALEAIFTFTSEFFARGSLDPRLLPTVDLAVEELFTNMVKYGANPAAAAEIRIALSRVEGGVEVELVDSGVDAFDPTRAPDVDTTLPLEARAAGGLGLHLVRRLVDSWSYDYSEARRESRITFTKTLAGALSTERKTTTGVT